MKKSNSRPTGAKKTIVKTTVKPTAKTIVKYSVKAPDKWAIVTGASAGIGEATAEVLAQLGFHVLVTGRRTDRLNELRLRLQKKYSIQVVPLVFDVSNLKHIQKVFLANESTFKKCEVLVNNAGLARGMDFFQDSKIEHSDEMIDTNVKGLLYMTRMMLPYFIKNQVGHIINLGSVAGRWNYPKGTVYSATKFAVRAITEGLRMDLLGHPIRVTNVSPGLVETEFSKVRLQDEEKAKSVYAGLSPLTPKDIAEVVRWSISQPKHVNIQEVVLYPTAQASVRDVYRRNI